jgi:glycosyltransferase involved in cell wall biosynthesis
MKLAIIRTSYEPLRLGVYNVQEIGLARELAKKGIETHIYSRFLIDGNVNGESKQISELITITTLKGKKIGKEVVFSVKDAQIPFEQYDWVQVQEYANLMSIPVIRAARSKGCKILINQGLYQDYKGVKKAYNTILDIVLISFLKKNVNKFFAKTLMAKEYLDSKGFTGVRIVPVGLDTSHFANDNYQAEPDFETFRKKFSRIVLYIGQIEARRNPSFIIDLIGKLAEKDPAIGFVMIGSGELSDWFDKEIADKNLKDRIFRKRSVSSTAVGQYYQQSDIFILPTNYEIFGMVVIEALFFGLPVLSTNTAGPNFILAAHKELGKCLPLQTEEWADSILKITDTDKIQNGSFRKEYVLNNFSWEKSCAYYESLDY